MHGGFNVPNMSGTLSSRNSSMNSVASGGVQQPTGNVPGGRFASNNIPVALSQMSHGSSHGGFSGIKNRGGMNVVGSPGYSNNANGVGGSIPGMLPTSAAIGNRNAVPGLGVNPALGNAGPRVTGSVGSMVGSGNIGRSIGSGGGLSVPGLTSRLNMSGNGGSGSLGMQGPNRLTSGVLQQGNVPKFPRVNVWDPYKRLGISPYAAEDEIWSSRNFLAKQYAGDERSVESIEGAFEKLLMRSFWERKRTKINLKTRLKKKVEESPPWFKNLLNFVELPATVIILRRLFLFAFMACWSIMNSAEGGPAFQVAISLGACIYFLNDKTKSLGRAAIIGFGSLVAGWLCGSCLGPMVPAAILPPTWSLELLTSLPVFVSLFLGCTFLK